MTRNILLCKAVLLRGTRILCPTNGESSIFDHTWWVSLEWVDDQKRVGLELDLKGAAVP